jgi:adenine-specific DNA-methyltransferase
LLSILNSHACAWFYSQISPQIQNGYYRFIAQYCQQIPIPAATPSEQAELETLVRRILENPTAGDVAVKEAEINEQVYRLFDLSREEIALIENDK